jgi:guanylate kinase
MWNSQRRGVLLVVSSPSGAGKSSLSRRLMEDHPEITLSVSATTRAPRPGEVDGRDYHFLSAEGFDALVSQGAFLEWAEVHGHRYGTLRSAVMEALGAGRDILFDIDWQGARALAEAAPLDAVRVFILPPSMQALEQRLHSRAQDSDDIIARRLAGAKVEIEKWQEYDYVLVNDDFLNTYDRFRAIYLAEISRRTRNPGLQGLVDGLLGA